MIPKKGGENPRPTGARPMPPPSPPPSGNFRMLVRNVRKMEARDSLLYRMARHIRNTDSMPPVEWGAAGGELLIELRELDPERYDREVKGAPDGRR